MSRTTVRFAAAAILCAVGLVVAPADSARATEQDSSLQQRINQTLAAYPGGVQTAPNEITWDAEDVVLRLEDPEDAHVRAAIGNCPSGAHCVYSATDLRGSQLIFNSCTTQSISPLGSPVRSIANARPSTIVRAYNDIGAVGSVSANSWTNTTWGMTKIGC